MKVEIYHRHHLHSMEWGNATLQYGCCKKFNTIKIENQTYIHRFHKAPDWKVWRFWFVTAKLIIKLSACKHESGKSCNRFWCDSKVPKYHPKVSNWTFGISKVPNWHFRISKGQILHFGLHFGREIEKILKLFFWKCPLLYSRGQLI